MTFGDAFLVNPDLFPARRSGEPWGSREVVLALPGGPYLFTGLSTLQEEAVRHRFGGWLLSPPWPESVVETRLFRISEAEFRPVDVRGWEYGLDFDFAQESVRLAGLRLVGRLDWRPDLAGALWTAEEGEAFAGMFENFFRVLVAYRLREQGGAVLHAAGIEAHGLGFLFLGRSGAGKTTLSRMAQERGATVLSDDLNALRLEGGRPVVEPLPFTGDLGDAQASSAPLPLGALFRLEKSPQDALRPLGRAEAAACLLSCSPFVNADPHRREDLLAGLLRLLAGEDPPAWALEVSLLGGFWSILERQWFPSRPAAS
jgi:hypothetical protein